MFFQASRSKHFIYTTTIDKSMLPIKKIYIDTRFKTKDSKSDTDFTIDLPNTYLMPENSVFYIDDVSIPVSWYTIEAGRNNRLYVRVNGVMHVLELTDGIYSIGTLSGEIQSKMNTIYPATSPSTFTVSTLNNTNQIKITCNYTLLLEILTDEQLLDLGYSIPLRSCNDVLRNTERKQSGVDNPFISNYIDLFPIRNLYLISSNLGNFNTISVSGECGIVKKIPVSANYNEMIFDSVVLGSDYLDCSKQLLSRFKFRLVDVFGNDINLHGNHWSFSIVFAKQDIGE